MLTRLFKGHTVIPPPLTCQFTRYIQGSIKQFNERIAMAIAYDVTIAFLLILNHTRNLRDRRPNIRMDMI